MRTPVVVQLTDLELHAVALDSSTIQFSAASRGVWMARRRAIDKLEQAAREVRAAKTQGRSE